MASLCSRLPSPVEVTFYDPLRSTCIIFKMHRHPAQNEPVFFNFTVFVMFLVMQLNCDVSIHAFALPA